MGYAEHIRSPKGNYWRARFKGADGKLVTVVDEAGAVLRFDGKRKAKKAADDREKDSREGRWHDPAAGMMLVKPWAEKWYAGLDLAPKTMANIKRHLEHHIIPCFGEDELRAVDAERIAEWKAQERAAGMSPNSIRTWHGTLHTLLEDAREAGRISVNPATARRGRGRRDGGARRSEVQKERVITSPLGILLIAERMSVLSGRDDELVMVEVAYGCALRLGELTGLEVPSVRAGGLNPRNPLRKVAGELRDEAVRVEWQLTEVEGELLRERPKNGSTGDLDLPPYLSRLIEGHVAVSGPQECPCHGTVHAFRGMGTPRARPVVTLRAVSEACGLSAETVRLALYGGRVSERTRALVQETAALLGWVRPGRPDGPAWHWRQSSFEGFFTAAVSGWMPPRSPLPRRPVPLTGEWPGTRLRGRAVSRASLRWEPVAEGMTPHGLRHSLKTRMEEAGIPEVASEARLRHEIPGVSGAYRHVTPEMRARVTAMLQRDWERALDERLAMSPLSPVAVLGRLLQERAEARKPRLVSSASPEAAGPVPLTRGETGPDLRRGDWI